MSIGADAHFPGFGQMYRVTASVSARAFCAELALDDDLPFARGEMSVRGPVRARWSGGAGRPSRVLATGQSLPMVVAESVVAVLRGAEVTGWSAWPVELRGRTGEVIRGYHALVVTGRCGPLDDERSLDALTRHPDGMRRVKRGLYFDQASWDRSDLFMPADGSAHVFAVERVRRAITTGRIGQLAFKALATVDRLWPLPRAARQSSMVR